MRWGAQGPRRGALLVVSGICLPSLCVLAYALWASGLHPFTAAADASVVAPVFVCLIGLGRGKDSPAAETVSFRDAVPLLAIVLVGLALEGLALGLGGRSPTVPTLSTVLDRALRWRLERAGLLSVWLFGGLIPTFWRRLGWSGWR